VRTGRRVALAITAGMVAIAGVAPTATASEPAAGGPDAALAPGTLEAAETAAARPWAPPEHRDRADVPTDRYEPAGGCYALQAANGNWVMRDGDGYVALAPSPGSAERFRLQATDLGTYLLYGSDRHLPALADSLLGETASDLPDSPLGGQLGGLTMGLTDDLARDLAAGPLSQATGRGSGLVATDEAGVLADWDLDVHPTRAGAFRLASVALPHVHLVVDGEATLSLADADAADGADAVALRRTDGCADWPEVEIGVTGPYVHAPSAIGEVRGHLDGHLHGMAFEFLGGRARCGQPWHPYGVEAALQGCPEHDLAGGRTHVLETFLSGRDPVAGHDTTGWPTFVDWPAHDSLTYEQTYHRWIERAWRGGLRMYVNLLVDNNQLCKIHPWKHNSCNEMDGVRLQAQRIREFERYIDAQYGGPGQGWLRIVTDPFEARRVMNEGRLAVVLGIEVSRLFDCDVKLGRPGCTAAEVDARLGEVYDLGVRQMELVNKFDNAFSGVAGDSEQTGLLVNGANVLETGSYWRMGACPDEHSHDRETADDAYKGHDRRQYNVGDEAGLPDEAVGRDALFGALLHEAGSTGAAPVYGPGPHCNALGLSDLGRHLLERMMQRGMLFDPDHMSAKGRHEAMQVMEQAGYSGVISSHSWADDDVYERIMRLGGVVTPMAGGSKGFVEQWQKLRSWADGRFPFGLGYGSDINGFATQGGPRGGASAVEYPFEGFGGVTVDRQRSGQRVFDLNIDGVAHYGLYPDWIEDLRVLAGEEIVADLERGPETYLQMWERALGVAPDACRDDVTDLRLDAVRRVGRGMPAEQVLLLLGQPTARGHERWTYCLEGGRTVELAFDADGLTLDAKVRRAGTAAIRSADTPRATGVAPGTAWEPAEDAASPDDTTVVDEHGHVHVAGDLAGAATTGGGVDAEALLPLVLLLAGAAGLGLARSRPTRRQ
jgi:microsomal dipeptidase-like Zn-dependent dipeptidase